jgi:hypothetical protein
MSLLNFVANQEFHFRSRKKTQPKKIQFLIG